MTTQPSQSSAAQAAESPKPRYGIGRIGRFLLRSIRLSPLPPIRRVNQEPVEPLLYFTVGLLGHLAAWLTKRDWRNQERLPLTGGILIVANHIGYFDPIAFGQFLTWNGRWPRFMAKRQLFSHWLIGPFARGCGQIPVDRRTANAASSISAAVEAIRAGQAVCIYPEGTSTRDPQLWPMTARSGAARIALETGCPVIPVGQWGAQEVMAPPKPRLPKFFPQATMLMRVGAPVEFADLRANADDRDSVREGSERIMDAITDLVAEARGEQPPPGRWDLRSACRVDRHGVPVNTPAGNRH